MDPTLVLVMSGIVLGVSAGAAALGMYTGRRASKDVIADLRDDWEADRVKTANLRTEIREYFDRAVGKENRSRAQVAATAKRIEAEQPQAQFADVDSYRAHVERTGQIIPEVEKALGLT